MNEELSKSAYELLCYIYKYNLILLDEDPKISAAHIKFEFCVECKNEDIDEDCKELHEKGYLNLFYNDDNNLVSTLTQKAKIEMENRFKNGIEDVNNFLEELK